MSFQTIPRTAVRSWLSLVRLPLTATELVVGKQGADWPPAVAFDGFEAGVKKGVGTLIGDSQLVQEGMLERGKVEQLRDAAELEAAAEQRRAEAKAGFDERKETVQERAQRVEREAEERKAKLEREEADRKRAVEETARRKEEAARKADQARQKTVAAQERQARAARLAAESEALDHEQEAAAAKADVLGVDQALKATKTARKQQR
ncbi:MAG: hypothetical protein AVDCRST_MAG76-1041 [uncultured Acidimicrobiales bacterium]|uniref:TolA protein n=1 Tax=uncultured Acidimicrobiales bacterium TaxID=310071 RepID=A0A6J4HMH2_9ACTN|nr:MAG: hypothetical protein AVDCRST_MAG76-1041 [uncultured Acidimicrobiales bacterium]